jgi:hypothetical protein
MRGWTRQWTGFALLLILVHLVLHVLFGLGRSAPDFLAVCALLSARRLPMAGAVAFGFIIGLLADSFAVSGFAASAMGLAVASGLGSYSQDYFEGDSLIFTTVYLLALGALSTFIAEMLSGRAGGNPVGAMLGALLGAIYTALAGAAALAAFRQVAGSRA